MLYSVQNIELRREVEVRAVDRKALLEALREPLPESTLSYGADVVGIRRLDSDYTEVECKNGRRIKTKVLSFTFPLYYKRISWL